MVRLIGFFVAGFLVLNASIQTVWGAQEALNLALPTPNLKGSNLE